MFSTFKSLYIYIFFFLIEFLNNKLGLALTRIEIREEDRTVNGTFTFSIFEFNPSLFPPLV